MASINSLISKEHHRLLENVMKTNKHAHRLERVIKNEIKILSEDVKERAVEFDTKLEEVRKELIRAGRLHDFGGAKNNRAARPECRIPLPTISKLIECSVNELLLYFLNGQRQKHEQANVEYSQGNVLFYGEVEEITTLK